MFVNMNDLAALGQRRAQVNKATLARLVSSPMPIARSTGMSGLGATARVSKSTIARIVSMPMPVARTSGMSDLSGKASKKQFNMMMAQQGIVTDPKQIRQMTPEQKAAQEQLAKQQSALVSAGLPTIQAGKGDASVSAEQAKALAAASLPTTITGHYVQGKPAEVTAPPPPQQDPLQQIRDKIGQWQAECTAKGGTWDATQGENVPGFGPTGACVLAPADPFKPLRDRINQWQAECAAKGGVWDPSQGENVPGFGPTGACTFPQAAPPAAPVQTYTPSVPADMPATPAAATPYYTNAMTSSMPSSGGGGGGGGWSGSDEMPQGGQEEGEEGMPAAPPPPPSTPPWVTAAAVGLGLVGLGAVWYFTKKPSDSEKPEPGKPEPGKAAKS